MCGRRRIWPAYLAREGKNQILKNLVVPWTRRPNWSTKLAWNRRTRCTGPGIVGALYELDRRTTPTPNTAQGQDLNADTKIEHEEPPRSRVENRHEKTRIGEQDCKLKIMKHWGVEDQSETEADWTRSEQEPKSRPVTTKSKFHERQNMKRISRKKCEKQRTRISDPTTPAKKDAQHHWDAKNQFFHRNQ
jgi:hypothetical protein